jgi:very-short-patch-repair endonuclease
VDTPNPQAEAEPAALPGPAPEQAGRAALVQEAARRWRGQLIDIGGRNTLLYYRDLKAGTLDLGSATSIALDALLAGRTVPLAQLYPDRDVHAQAVRRARTIRNKARELREERGIETCFLATGMATWANPKGGATPASPVLLRSATIAARGAAEDDFDLTLTGDLEFNPTLLHVLVTDFDLVLDADELEDLEPALLYERLAKEATGRVPGFAVAPRQVLGTFSYAKLPMVTDLVAGAETLLGHEVVAAIAGDRAAQATLRAGGAAVDPAAPDRIAPADEFIVLDADSSQEYAINAVVAGQHAVVKGPPGTGKSQTIANLIATLAARGQRVLFVAEKRAAISAVTDRLARAGLDDLVMDVHGGTSTRRRIATELKAALDDASRIAQPDLTELHERLVDRRARLAGYGEALHAPREPWGVSVFAARAALLGTAAVEVRLRGEVLAALDATTTRRVREELREYVGLGGLRESAWAGAAIRTAGDAQQAYEAVDRLHSGALMAARTQVSRVAAEAGLAEPTRLGAWPALFDLLDGVATTLSTLDGSVFGRPELAAATAPRAWRRQHRDHPGAGAGWLTRRRLRREARGLWRGAEPPARSRLFEALLAAYDLGQRWERASRPGQLPRLPAGLPAATQAYTAVAADLMALDQYLPAEVGALCAAEAADLTARLVADVATLRRLPRINELAEHLRDAGLGPLLARVRPPGADPDTAVAMFDRCWYASILDHVSFTDPRIGAFDGEMHSRTAVDYRASDHRHIASTATRVQRAVAEHVVAARDAYPEESRLVERQANLKRRHLPIRQLFAAAPHLMTALKPCWAMSPLVVSQLLPADGQYFDVVIFDEASQVTPADAVPAIMRARHVVVAGDEHQLPPTTFFTTADEHDDTPLGVTADGAIDPALTSGYESILDVLSALLRGYTLRWHYRSRDERLIAFSNAWVYGRSLVTFPGAAGAGDCVRFVPVDAMPVDAAPVDSLAADGEQADSVGAEVDRVVSLVLEHAATRPGESLGVITMGIVHADRIESALRTALRARPDLHGFFDEARAEPFFVKNLERVQGDERDAVILSIGYGKTADGRLLYRFGPLLLPGGHRRLNVAVTRARRSMTLVSSFRSADLDPARSSAEGVRLLRAYLEYAESGGVSLGAAAVTKPALNPFEVDVRDRLAEAGIPVVAQYGVAGYFIDFAASHPSRPAEMVLAIEADGASYHSSGTVRDRDRLRQEHLERLGWSFHRIWSTDWFADPEAEVRRVRAAYDAAVAVADAKAHDGTTHDGTADDNGDDSAPHAGWDPSRTLELDDGAHDGLGDGADGAGGGPGGGYGGGVDDGPVVVDPTPTVRLSDLAGRPGPRPELPRGAPITAYRQDQLMALVRWVESDTLLRTEEQLLDEVVRELGFSRKGPRIREAVLAAVRAARRAG